MKNINSIITIIALLILIGIGWYLLREQRALNNQNAEVYTLTVNGEEVELDYPLVRSFSNEASNNEQAVAAQTSTRAVSQQVVQSVVQAVTQPFVFGVYYINTLLGHGVDQCTGRVVDISESHSTQGALDDVTLTRLEITNNQAYLFVDATETPRDRCALITQLKDIPTSFLKGIHVLVNQK